MHNYFLLLFCTLVAFWASSVHSAEISIRSGNHPKSPSAAFVSYRASCPEAEYELEFDMLARRLYFKSSLEARAIDITDSAAGRAFLRNKLYGRTALGCAIPGLNVFFVGYRIESGESKPTSYTVVIETGGVLNHSEGLRDESDDYVKNKRMP